MDPQQPVVLTSVTSEVQAAAIVTALSAHGIQAFATGGHTASFRAESPGYVQVVVRQEDYAAARRVLTEFQSGHTEIDWSQVDVGEPEEPV